MPRLSNERLFAREEMLQELLRAGQFAHLSEADLARSLDSLWRVSDRLKWLSEDKTRAACAERAVSMALVKAAETGLLPPHYFDAQVVDWVGRTEPTLCCLCFGIGFPSGCPYDVPLDFVSYVLPTFLRLDVPYDVRRPFCSKCAWAVAGRVWREQGMETPLANEPAFWGAALAHLPSLKGFRDRVQASAGNVARLRFDPRREPQQVAA